MAAFGGVGSPATHDEALQSSALWRCDTQIKLHRAAGEADASYALDAFTSLSEVQRSVSSSGAWPQERSARARHAQAPVPLALLSFAKRSAPPNESSAVSRTSPGAPCASPCQGVLVASRAESGTRL